VGGFWKYFDNYNSVLAGVWRKRFDFFTFPENSSDCQGFDTFGQNPAKIVIYPLIQVIREVNLNG